MVGRTEAIYTSCDEDYSVLRDKKTQQVGTNGKSSD